MEEPLAAAGAAEGAVGAGMLRRSDAIKFAGGLPGGVVEVSVREYMVRWELDREGSISPSTGDAYGVKGYNILAWAGELRPCLKDWSIVTGNVCPFSQISRSFLIFSYTAR